MRSGVLSILLLALTACRAGEGNGTAASPGRSALSDGPLAEPVLPRQSLPPLASLGRNGMRVSIAAWDSDYAFLVEFIPLPLDCYLPPESPFDPTRFPRQGCNVVQVRFGRIGQSAQAGPARVDEFMVPESDYRDLLAQFEFLAANWSDPHGTLDGTVIGVEYFREGRLRSLASNDGGPASPTATLGTAVHRLLLAYGPSGAVPRSSSFMILAVESDFPCMATDFAEPDRDGFGTGDDACARFRAARAGMRAPRPGAAAR